jgi:hypothetical protein
LHVTARTCINQLEADGTIDPDRAHQYRFALDDLESTYKRQFGASTAEALASKQLIKGLEYEAAIRARQQMLQMGAQKKLLMAIDKVIAAGKKAVDAVQHVFSPVEGLLGADGSIDLRHAALRRHTFTMINDFLEKVHRTPLGALTDAAAMDNIVREMHGQNSGDASAKALAASITKGTEYLRLKFNAAGGAIARMEHWFPHAHDTLRVRQASFEEWRDFLLPKLDRDKMIDNMSGLPISDQRLELALREVHETIRTDGYNKLIPGQTSGLKLANRHADHRFLHFTDGDAWLAYADRFGMNAFDAITGHIDSLARDVAAMEVLGPNPALTVRWLGDLMVKDANVRGGADAILAANKSAKLIDQMWRSYTGEITRSVNPQLSRAFRIVRNLNVASKLGGAVILGQADHAFTHAASVYNGLPAAAILGRWLSLLNPQNAADRALARQTMGVANEWTGRARALHQANGFWEKADELSKRMASGVLHASGLAAFTAAGLHATGLEYMAQLARDAAQPFAALDPVRQGSLRRYGIGPDDFELIRSAPRYTHQGTDFIRPDEMAARTDIHPLLADGLATKMHAMIEGEKRFGMPDAGSSLRVHAALNTLGGAAEPVRGTVGGELLWSMTQFKQFPATVMQRSLMRTVYGDQGFGTRAEFTAKLIIGTWAMGALIMQSKNVVYGKDPEPMDSVSFWVKALLTGGGAGLYGDYLREQINRVDQTPLEFVAGPTIGQTVNPITSLLFNDPAKAVEGHRPTVGREITMFLKNNTPGSSLWYSRLALDRLVWNQLQKAIDPRAEGSFARQEQRAAEADHTRFWWRPGEITPDRRPNPANAGGAEAP